ncbi:MAG TPA: NUDIX domain-containing protein [Prolixibacteraceae bacterium]|nr:NUDIX domain-containing protein [Prolixibacteraceae bacterium]HPS13744.1 NUDIX domain-containing protein [Prolixibacteraceae bacterium]
MPYSNKEKFYVAVDCVIFGFDGETLKLLLYKRDFEPEKGNWSLMGGFLRENENLDAAAYRVLARITGLRNIYMEQLSTFSSVDRDSEDRVISTAYFSLIQIQDYDVNILKDNRVEWFSIDQLPPLIFDHNEMVEKALKRLKRRAKSEPIGFELLPEKFTITQLRNLYSAIYQRNLEPANFRRKIMSMDLLDRLPMKEKNGSKKGSFLYSFDKQKYENFTANGFSFDLTGV